MSKKIKLGLRKLSIPDLLSRAQQITDAMTGNANFTTPNPTIVTVTSATTALQTAHNEANAARMESKSKTIVQNEQEDRRSLHSLFLHLHDRRQRRQD